MVHKEHNEFTSLITHQLREPLTNIKWVLSLLVNGEAGDLSSEQKELIGKAFRSGEHALSLIDDMLKADRIDSSTFDIYPVDSDFVEIVQKAFDELKTHADQKKIQFALKADHKNTPLISIDPAHIGEAVLNLLENALHYTPQGGKVEALVTVEGNNVIFSVTDTGIGIPKEEISKISSRFFRATNAHTANEHGSGLGLFIVRRIVERHGGTFGFESIEGSGSVFHIALPFKN